MSFSWRFYPKQLTSRANSCADVIMAAPRIEPPCGSKSSSLTATLQAAPVHMLYCCDILNKSSFIPLEDHFYVLCHFWTATASGAGLVQCSQVINTLCVTPEQWTNSFQPAWISANFSHLTSHLCDASGGKRLWIVSVSLEGALLSLAAGLSWFAEGQTAVACSLLSFPIFFLSLSF